MLGDLQTKSLGAEEQMLTGTTAAVLPAAVGLGKLVLRFWPL